MSVKKPSPIIVYDFGSILFEEESINEKNIKFDLDTLLKREEKMVRL